MPSEIDGPYVRFEFRNSVPCELLDLTASLSALGEAYQDFVSGSGLDHPHGNTKLFIREIRSGSIIADLVSQAHQASFVFDHADAIAGFASHFNDVLQWFLILGGIKANPPTNREASQALTVMEPVAKDGGSQLFLSVHGDVHFHQHYDYGSLQANVIQNGARRFLGPRIPTVDVYHDQILSLFQVRGDPSASVGDRGIIESISSAPAKLLFASEGVKNIIIGQPENPFQKLFIVDVEARVAEGRVRLYYVLAVKDVMDKD
jgi:hypothetical protein